MKKFKRILMVLSLFLLVGCSSKDLGEEATKTEDKKATKEFVLGTEWFGNSMDPAIEWEGWETIRLGIGETLFKFNDKLQLEPWLAEKYENIDPNTWEITLKANLTFSNGEQVTPEMVVKNFERVAKENSRAEYLIGAEYKIDGNKITIKTTEPRASLMNDLSDPYAIILDLDNTKDLKKNPIGTGAYKVDKLVEDSHIELAPNEHYWNGKPKLDKVTVKQIADKETGAIALKNGEIDGFIELNPQSFLSFKDNPEFISQSVATSRVFSVYYNLETLDDINLRKAIHLSLDKNMMGESLLNKSMEPTQGAFPESTLYGSSNLTTESFNMEAAQKLLSESGYTDSDKDGFLDKDGEKISLRIAYYSRLSNEQLATEIQSTLAKLGIESKVKGYDNPDYFETGDYDLGLYTMVTLPTGDAESYIEGIVKETGDKNYNNYNNPKAEELLSELQKEFDPAKRATIVNEIQQIILDDCSMEFLGFNNLNLVTSNKVKGMKVHPTDYYRITVDLDVE